MSLRTARRIEGVRRTLIRRIFDAAPADAINLGLGQPDLPTPDAPSLAGVAAIVEGRTSYSPTAGYPELRAAVASRYGVPGAADGVLITVGTQEAIFAACVALLEPGTELLYPDPGYPAYPVVARLVGARPVAYPLRAERAFRLDPEDVLSRIGARSGAVILCAPSNPTGAGIAREDLVALTAELERRGVPWISDEVYAGFTWLPGGFTSPGDVAPGTGLVISGLSKDASMTGWRIGWVVGPPATVRRLVAVHQYLVTCAPSVSQRAALAALSPAGRVERERYRERFARRRAAMAEELARIPGLRFTPPDGAFYFFVDASRHGDSRTLARRILERCNVVVIPGEAFGERGAGWLRLSFACREPLLREALHRIAEELRRRG